ncbi:MAG: glycosyltransferase [Rubricella sp.]
MNVSIVVEWENALLIDLDRPIAMLEALVDQANALRSSREIEFELLIMADFEEIEPHVVETALRESGAHALFPGAIRIEDAPGLHYYEQKNIGAERARHDLLIFLDSDVVPEPGWLEALVAVFDDPSVNICAGNPYIDDSGLWSRIFALFWFFEPRTVPSDAGLTPARSLNANNLAVRRAFFLSHRYAREDSYRGQCRELAKRLRAGGEALYRQPRARVAHPPPSDRQHFIQRAAAHGHGAVYWSRKRHGVWAANPLTVPFWFLARAGSVVRNVLRRRRASGAGWSTALAAVGVGVFYYLVAAGAALVATINRKSIRRRVSI